MSRLMHDSCKLNRGGPAAAAVSHHLELSVGKWVKIVGRVTIYGADGRVRRTIVGPCSSTSIYNPLRVQQKDV